MQPNKLSISVQLAAGSVSSILLIRLSSLGDVLLATPLVRVLRRRYPAARLDVAVAAEFAEVWTSNPYVSNIISIDRSRSAFASRSVRRDAKNSAGQYDVVIDLQRNLRSLVLRRNMYRQIFLYDKHRAEKIELVRSKKFPEVITHVVDRYFNAVAESGIINDGEGLELWLPEERERGEYLSVKTPAQRGKSGRLIAIAPGARHETKRWLPEHFARTAEELSRNYQAEIVLVGGVDDKLLCDEIRATCSIALTNSSGSTSFYETARILDACDALITNDSGVMHIAAARRIPVVAIFGSTVPAFGFAPYGTTSAIVETELSCRPCSHIGRESCPLGHFHCMKMISVGEVIAALLTINH